MNGPAAPGAHRDSLLAGGVFVVVGIAFAVGATQYDLGSALRMGPGYLPLVLGAVLTGLGLIIVGRMRLNETYATLARAPASRPWRRARRG